MQLKILSTGSCGNCYVINENGKLFLLDFGISINEIKKGVNYKISDVVGGMCTHRHNDHSKSLKRIQNMGIPVFTPFETDDVIQAWKKHDWILKAFPVPHDDCTCYGLLLETPQKHKMLYITDFQYCKYSFSKIGIQTILIECNYNKVIDGNDNKDRYYHVLRGHASLGVVKEFLRVNQTEELKTVILCHLSAENADPDEMVRQVQEAVGSSVRVIIARKEVSITL